MRSLVAQLLHAVPAVGLGNGRREAYDPCPTAIQGSILYRHRAPDKPVSAFSSMESLHAAMLTCPDIAVLQVAMAGCSSWYDHFSFPFDAAGGEQYPSAPVLLSLDGYDADHSEWNSCRYRFQNSWSSQPTFGARLSLIWRCLHHLSLPAAQRTKSNLDLWLDAMDFSRIQTLQLNDTRGEDYVLTEQVAAKLPPRLASLESLAVHNAIAEQFILALPNNSLSHLSWRNPRKHCSGCRDVDADSSPLKRVLLSQGSSLRSLEYRTDECDSRTPPALSLEDLRALVTLAPNLNSLALDLERHDNGTRRCPSWPWETLELLAESLPELTDLTIHFGLTSKCHRQQHWQSSTIYYHCSTQCLGPDRYAKPLLNKTSATEMARFLHQHKTGRPFESLTFRAGDWTAPWHEPLVISRWLKGQRVWVACRLADTPLGDQPGEPRDSTSEMVCDAEDTLTPNAYHEWDEHCSPMAQDEIWKEEKYQEILPTLDNYDGL